MYQKKDYRILRTVANLVSGLGWLVAGFWALIGLIAGWQVSGVFVGLVFGVAGGLFIGIPFIVSGQLVSVFLDQKELLEEIMHSIKQTSALD